MIRGPPEVFIQDIPQGGNHPRECMWTGMFSNTLIVGKMLAASVLHWTRVTPCRCSAFLCLAWNQSFRSFTYAFLLGMSWTGSREVGNALAWSAAPSPHPQHLSMWKKPLEQGCRTIFSCQSKVAGWSTCKDIYAHSRAQELLIEGSPSYLQFWRDIEFAYCQSCIFHWICVFSSCEALH